MVKHSDDNKLNIVDVKYYLTWPTLENKGIVKLGAKGTADDGKQYGNVIQIPFAELKRLVDEVSKHE